MPLTRQEGEFSQVSNIIQVEIPPAPPSAVVLTLGPATSEADLSWTASTPATGDTIDGYQVWRSVDGGPFSLLTTTAGDVLVYVDTTISLESVYDYYVIAHATIGGDSPQSNIVELVQPPSLITQILVGFMGDETWLISSDFTTVIQGGSPDSSLGWENGYETNEDGTIIGSYGAYLEGASAGANRSDDQGISYASDGSPIYNNAPQRVQRVAYGGADGDRYFLHMGTRQTTGLPSCAWSSEFGNDAFTWAPISLSLFVTQPTKGFAGVDAIPVDSATFDATGDTLFCAYTNQGQVYAGDGKNGMILYGTGGPSIAFDTSHAPYARFAGQGFGDNDVIVGMYAGKIVVTINGSETWDMTTYNDAFTTATLIGGIGFTSPVVFGLAYGAGAWIACGNIPQELADPLPQISRSTVGAETPWPTIAVPAGIDRLWDVIYDRVNSRFLMLGQEIFSDPETETTTFFFHVLQSLDGGVTWTDEVRQEYNSGQDPDKGWIKVFTSEPPTFFLKQEDDSFLNQETDSHIKIDDDVTGTYPNITNVEQDGIFNDITWTGAVAQAPGTLVEYQVYGISAFDFVGGPTFIGSPEEVPVHRMTLLATVSDVTLTYQDTSADNTVSQYCYCVRAITTSVNMDSNHFFSSAPS